MKIQPRLNYSMSGYGQLDCNKTYAACVATNQPNYVSEGKIFVESNDDLRIELLLTKNEYTIVK